MSLVKRLKRLPHKPGANSDSGISRARCEDCGWDNDGQLVRVDRWITDYPPIPYVPLIEFYRDRHGDPDDRLIECPECHGELVAA